MITVQLHVQYLQGVTRCELRNITKNYYILHGIIILYNLSGIYFPVLLPGIPYPVYAWQKRQQIVWPLSW